MLLPGKVGKFGTDNIYKEPGVQISNWDCVTNWDYATKRLCNTDSAKTSYQI